MGFFSELSGDDVSENTSLIIQEVDDSIATVMLQSLDVVFPFAIEEYNISPFSTDNDQDSEPMSDSDSFHMNMEFENIDPNLTTDLIVEELLSQDTYVMDVDDGDGAFMPLPEIDESDIEDDDHTEFSFEVDSEEDTEHTILKQLSRGKRRQRSRNAKRDRDRDSRQKEEVPVRVVQIIL